MRRILDLRIVRWELKLLYVAAAYGILYPIRALLFAAGVVPFLVSLVDAVVTIGLFLLGARVFRGAGEPVAPPRAWWRMTAWPVLSRNLGIIFAFGALSVIVYAVRLAQTDVAWYSLVDTIISIVPIAVIAFLYLNSAVRMKRLGISKPESFLPRGGRLRF